MNARIIPIAPPVTLGKIVFATDFSDASKVPLPVLGALARRFRSQVVLTHICSDPPVPLFAPETAPMVAEHSHEAASEAMKRVLCADVLEGIRLRVELREGDPVEGVVELAETEKADLIVVGTHGRHGFKRFILGSIAEGVIRKAPCPVLTVGPHVDRRFSDPHTVANILVPTDLSADASGALPYISAIAGEFKARVHFLHVLPAETASHPLARELFEPLRRRMENELVHQVPPSCRPEFVIGFGDEANSTCIMGEEIDADLIILGVRRSHWTAMDARGSVAYKTIASALCPVLTVRNT